MSGYCRKCGFPVDFLIDGLCRECYEYDGKKDFYDDNEYTKRNKWEENNNE